MLKFNKIVSEQEKINSFLAFSAEKIYQLSDYENYISVSDLKRIRNNFEEKVNDFCRNDRKLNIGVIGQVKAGKSTFLNALLFDGKEVLPSARTPKTATLTKIEYGDKNSICVDYYSFDEWSLIEEYSRSDIVDNEHNVAREIMKMVSENNVDPYSYLEKCRDEITFDSSISLMGELNEYVGENGKLTPFVKNVTIYMNCPELEDISVVDTPGLNDAIVSRTDKTREFIEKCDVVFFLSRASQFIDDTDMKLVTSQLPQKGVERLILICSRFDEGLLDELRKIGSLRDTVDSVKQALCKQAEEIIKRAKNEGRNVTRVLEQCRIPIFISSIVYNMAYKSTKEYSRNDEFIYKKLNKFNDLTSDLMMEIGNMSSVKTVFEEVVAKKEATLEKKAKLFLPRVYDEWNSVLRMLSDEAEGKLQVLKTGDKEILAKQKRAVELQISDIRASLETVLGELLLSLEKTKGESIRKLRDTCRECSRLQEQTGTEWHTGSRLVGQKKFLWMKWGGHKETYSYTTSYTYLAASDALENIRTFGFDACSDIEAALQRAVDVKSTKHKLLQTVLENFDSSDENFDINHFRYITESSLNRLEFPVIKIDITPFLQRISSQFSGEIRDSSNKSNLRSLLAETMEILFEEVSEKFNVSVTKFKKSIDVMHRDFCDDLLKNIQNEFEALQKQFENKEVEIVKYVETIEMLANSAIK